METEPSKKEKNTMYDSVFECSENQPEKCSNTAIKTKLITNSTYAIILGGMVTAFTIGFAFAISDTIKTYIGDKGAILNIVIMLILAIICIYFLLHFQQNKKFWEHQAEKREIKI